MTIGESESTNYQDGESGRNARYEHIELFVLQCSLNMHLQGPQEFLKNETQLSRRNGDTSIHSHVHFGIYPTSACGQDGASVAN